MASPQDKIREKVAGELRPSEQVEAACGDGAAAERVDDLGAAGGGGGWRAHRFPPRNWVRKRSSSRWSSWALRSTVMTP